MINPGWRRADFVCLAVGLGLPFFHQIKLRWMKQISHIVAKYSYGIYLFHPFSILIALKYLKGWPVSLQLAALSVSLLFLQ